MSPSASGAAGAIRPPRRVEGAACRMLLPGLHQYSGSPEVLIAVQEASPNIAGALSFLRLPDVFGSLRLRVVRTARRRGIGSLLLSAALDDARRSGVRAVYARADSESDPDACSFLCSRGFRHTSSLITVAGDVDALHDTIARARERLQARGRIPSHARVISFPMAPREEIARLFAEHIAHNPELAARLAVPSPRDEALSASPVVMVGDEVAGYLLWSLENGVAHVHARVVSPPYRHLWPNTVLLAEAMARAARAGAVRTSFEVPGKNEDTRKLARRFRADTISTVDLYRLDVALPQLIV